MQQYQVAPSEQILIFLAVAVFIVTIFKKMRLSPVLGYLVAGSFLGSFGIAENEGTIKFIAKLGIVFLLFSIGLELTFERLKSMRMQIFGFGSMQVIITTSIIFGILLTIFQAPSALIVGGCLAFSSTAVVFQVLSEKGIKATKVGKLSISTLILQDIAVIPLIIMIPLLGASDQNIGYILGSSFLKGLLVFAFILIVGRRVLRPMLNAIDGLKSREIFVAFVIVVILGMGWLTELAGLSSTLGAFLAGLLIAETTHRIQIETDLLPFKGILLGIFFMTVGMDIDFNLLKEKFFIILGLTIVLMILKASIIFVLAKMFKYDNRSALESGITLSQGSEFAFVLIPLVVAAEFLSNEIASILLLIIALSMALTGVFSYLGELFADKVFRKKGDLENDVNISKADLQELSQETESLTNHIIIMGYDIVGRNLSRILLANRYENFVCIHSNLKEVKEARKDGVPIYYGKTISAALLEALHLSDAQMLVITLQANNHVSELIKSIRQKYPTLSIIVRAQDHEQSLQLKKAGATYAMPESFESSLLLSNYLFQEMGLPKSEVEQIIANFKEKFV